MKHKMKSLLAGFLALLLLIFAVGCKKEEQPKEDDSATPAEAVSVLAQTADAGIGYQDSLTFFGESTTAHLRSRGVLTGGKNTKQVWSDSGNTKMLTSQSLYETIVDPETDGDVTVAEAVTSKQPSYLVLSFGLNGLSGFIQNKDGYLGNYRRLIDGVLQKSPNTKIILQTVYPVAANCSHYENPAEINQQILTLNEWLLELTGRSVRVCDTASVLRDSDGALKPSYDNGDGYHLTASAYTAILTYLRTHAWVD